MFTGIITDVGEVLSVALEGDMRARIGTAYDTGGIDIGASIACDGVCLTVVALGRRHAGADRGWFDVQISAETLSKTNIGAGGWKLGQRLNLERALKVGDELGGHIVSGHVDGVARLVSMTDEGASTRMVFEVPDDLARFVASKGSVALNGTSLTVNEVSARGDGAPRFGVNIIPHTKEVTTWGLAQVGDRFNFEVDTMARYVARLQDWG